MSDDAPDPNAEPEKSHIGISLGLTFGVVAAFAIGLATDNLGLWIGIGIPAGLVAGMLYDAAKHK